jgi:hypothetical protein
MGRWSLTRSNRTSQPTAVAPYRKFLLLGCGDGGKSSFLKNTRALYQMYNSHELAASREQVASNLLEFIGQLITACDESELHLQNLEAVEYIEKAIQNSQTMVSVSSKMDWELVHAIKTVWKEKSIQIVFANRKEFQVNENGAFWMEHLDRITDDDYVPTMEDFLRTKMKTVGILETEKVEKLSECLINKSNNPISLVDVGGQRTYVFR